MKEGIKYIDKIVGSNLKNYGMEPLTSWNTLNLKLSSVDNTSNLIKTQFQLKKFFNIQYFLISALIAVIGSAIFILGKQDVNYEDYKVPIERIGVNQNIKKSQTIQPKLKPNKTVKKETVIIRKEIIIRDTLYMRNTVHINE